VNAAVEKVQTGGFGDDNGLKGTGKQGAKLYAASAGGFDMPVGPGQGNGSGGAKGIKGTVASADFGNGIATGGKGDGRSSGQGVATGGFGSEQVVHGGPKIAADMGPATTPVEITFKPNPVYTDEARSLKLEGEVLLEVSFSANGTLHVNRVVRGLGHGLDEAASRRGRQDPIQAGIARWAAGGFHGNCSRDIPDGVGKFWRSNFGNLVQRNWFGEIGSEKSFRETWRIKVMRTWNLLLTAVLLASLLGSMSAAAQQAVRNRRRPRPMPTQSAQPVSAWLLPVPDQLAQPAQATARAEASGFTNPRRRRLCQFRCRKRLRCAHHHGPGGESVH
jgi:hypothetical protein